MSTMTTDGLPPNRKWDYVTKLCQEAVRAAKNHDAERLHRLARRIAANTVTAVAHDEITEIPEDLVWEKKEGDWR
jgi:hypothetical protein